MGLGSIGKQIACIFEDGLEIEINCCMRSEDKKVMNINLDWKFHKMDDILLERLYHSMRL